MKTKISSLIFPILLTPISVFSDAVIFLIDSASDKFYTVNDDGSDLQELFPDTGEISSPDNLTVNANFHIK